MVILKMVENTEIMSDTHRIDWSNTEAENQSNKVQMYTKSKSAT